MHELIELHNLTKTYRRGREEIRALDGITLNIRAGEFVAVVGPSGSGKSTLLNMIGAMDRPSAGTLRLAGQDIARLDDRALTRLRATTIGFVFQQFFLQPTLSAEENVLLPTLFVRRNGAAQRAEELLRRVGLNGRARHLPAELSGGEMQRVAIARALINAPQILLADEPTGNLDSKNAQAIYAILDELHATGLTVVVVTHNDALAERAQRRIHLLDGRIVEDVAQPSAKEVGA